MNKSWIPISERLPEMNVLVALINVDIRQNDAAGEYPVGRLGHLADFGGHYWSCYGGRAQRLDTYTHWLALPEIPWREE